MTYQTSKRNIFQRIMGKPLTGGPADDECWRVEDGQLRIDLARARELASPYGAISFEDASLPGQVLVLRDGRDAFHAVENKCTHGGRRLDPVPGTETVCCCSMGKSVFDYEGNLLAGSAEEPLKVYPVSEDDGWLTINLA